LDVTANRHLANCFQAALSIDDAIPDGPSVDGRQARQRVFRQAKADHATPALGNFRARPTRRRSTEKPARLFRV
jgi:hypothetical protein